MKAAQDVKLVPATGAEASQKEPVTDSDRHAKLKRLCDKRNSLDAAVTAAKVAVQEAQDELQSLTKAREIIEEDYKTLYKACGPAQEEGDIEDVRMAEEDAALTLPSDCMDLITRMESVLGATDSLQQTYDNYFAETAASGATPQQPAAWLAEHTRKELRGLQATVQSCARVAQFVKRRRTAATDAAEALERAAATKVPA